jgi:Holliday junction resolvase RusA-like endonuclease
MSKNLIWSADDLRKKGLVQNQSGDYVPVKSLVNTGKIEKLPNLLERALLQKVQTVKLPPVKRHETAPPDFNGCATVHIKPLSVNEAFKGKRFRTDKYNAYKLTVGVMLPKHYIIPDGYLKVYYEFGLSNLGGDWDNPCKPFQDILQETYGFNDSRITEAHVKKVLVAKGAEYIRFKIESL